MSFVPSPYQQSIFNFIKKEKGSAIIEAVAGSGKTTTIVQALNLIPETKNVVFLAFNKSIAEELKTRVPAHVNVATLNSLGHRAWLRYRDGRKISLNANKSRDILNSLIDTNQVDEYRIRPIFGQIRKLISVAKSMGLAPNGVNVEGLLPDVPATWEGLIDHFDIQFDIPPSGMTSNDKELAISVAKLVLTIGLNKLDEIDFDDQIYMTVLYGAPVPKHDFVFVDEAQDVSDIQRCLVSRALKPKGRLVAVGDPCQAIYGFRGASAESMDNIRNEFKCTKLPLSISYRCPQNIVREAQQFVGHIEAAPTAPIGEVVSLGHYKHDMFKTGDNMVICRNTAPLIKLAYYLIGNGVAARILGRDIGTGLVNLINKLRPKGIDGLVTKLGDWQRKERQRLLAKDGEDADFSKVDDKVEVIMTFIESSKATTVPALIEAIQNLFSEDKGSGVLLCTVHKSKGLEADNVFILDSELMPSRYARKQWQRIQERNLQYVAVTRAKKVLGYVQTPKCK